jgi:uncharacterized Rmd1/YagE family protein
LNTLIRFPHSYKIVNKIKFKTNDNALLTCGKDDCVKSWILKDNKPVASNESSSVELTSNWVYNSCNGYREYEPSEICFIEDRVKESKKEIVAVSFRHVVVLWSFDKENETTFLTDLVHCDEMDFIKKNVFYWK